VPTGRWINSNHHPPPPGVSIGGGTCFSVPLAIRYSKVSPSPSIRCLEGSNLIARYTMSGPSGRNRTGQTTPSGGGRAYPSPGDARQCRPAEIGQLRMGICWVPDASGGHGSFIPAPEPEAPRNTRLCDCGPERVCCLQWRRTGHCQGDSCVVLPVPISSLMVTRVPQDLSPDRLKLVC
jgi:hypothetical protein